MSRLCQIVLHRIVAAVTVVAVAGGPVAAAMRPCCCSRTEKAQAGCCRQAKSETPASGGQAVRSCCAKHKAPIEHVDRGDCCCFKAAPATAPQDKSQKQVERQLIGCADWLAGASPIRPAAELVRHASRPCLTASLLALYCTWLK
jgi:hypothetical protein